jgi:4-carboxymuconolactone decarboxylase
VIKDELFERGLQTRREMFGPAGAEEQTDNADEFNDKLQEIVTRYIFGDIWAREGLTRRERSMITLGMLLALGRPHELRTHLRGAVANGLTKEEIREILLHSFVYCGIAASAEGFRAAGEVLAELEQE